MRTIRFLLLLLLSSLGGCGIIYSVEPLGNQIAVVDPKLVGGFWLTGSGTIVGMKVIDKDNGVVTTWFATDYSDAKAHAIRCEAPVTRQNPCGPSLADVWGCAEKAEPNRTGCSDHAVATCSWRRYGKIFFPVVKDSEIIKDSKRNAYLTSYVIEAGTTFAEAAKGPLEIKVFYLRERAASKHTLLGELIEQGRLPRRYDEDGVPILGPLTEEHYDAMFRVRSDWLEKSGSTLIKLPDALNPCKKGDKGK